MSNTELRCRKVKKFVQTFAGKALILLAIMCTVSLAPVSDAHANTQQCKALHRQLASLPTGSSANYRKYDKAAKRQASELKKAKKLRSRAKCNVFSGGQCSTLRKSIRRMESNYRKLITTRDRYANRGSAKRVSIKRKIAALRCGSITKTVKTVKNGRRKIIVRNGGSDLRPSLSTAPKLGGYRTLCVRTCDGYYFPVSHASTGDQLKRDESICKALCPASPTQLFVHRNADQETEDMVSFRGGQPYTTLPTAFNYRTQVSGPNCSCGAANPRSAGLALSESEKLAGLAPVSPNQDDFLDRLPPPTKRPNMFADAETLAHEATGLTRETIMRFIGDQTGEMEVSSSNRKVRVVGPEFLPDPSTAINLQAPGPTAVQ